MPFIILGYYQIGLQFEIRSSIAILGLALCLGLVSFPDVTPDKLLTAIISEKNEQIQNAIVNALGRGITIYQGKGGHGKHGESSKASEILFTVVTRLELGRQQNLIKGIDPDAFIIQHSINDVQGGIIKKRALH